MIIKPIASIVFGLALRDAYCHDYTENGGSHCFLRSSSSQALHNNEVRYMGAATFDPTPSQSLTTTGESHSLKRRLSSCGMNCWSYYDCYSSLDGCTMCDFSYGYYGRCVQTPWTTPSSPPWTISPPQSNNCVTQCTDSWQCKAKSGACSFCEKSSYGVLGMCVEEKKLVLPCASDFSALKSGLENSSVGTVIICQSTTITLTSEIIANGSNKQLQCQNGTGSCGIRRQPSSPAFRLLTFTGNNIGLSGVTFSNGMASGDGGGVLIYGTGNTVKNCSFNNNVSFRGFGGGLSMKSGTLQGNSYGGNSASKCNDAHVNNQCASS